LAEGLACIIVCELFILSIFMDELFIDEELFIDDELFMDDEDELFIACMVECIGLADGDADAIAAASRTFSMPLERRTCRRG
jgi:hypothetical protein